MLPVDQAQHGITGLSVGQSIGKRIVYADVIEVPPTP